MDQRILSIDIGGSKIKGSVIGADGKLLQDYLKLQTPSHSTPENVLATIKQLADNFQYDLVSVGFPGYVRDGVVFTAPNLGTESWQGVQLAYKVWELLQKPAKVANDADLLGLGVVKGEGLELMITLGTGFGTAMYLNGKLLPHLEIAHHPIAKGKTYDQYIGNNALQDVGRKKWNKRVQLALQTLKTVINYDTLYIGGGNSKYIDFALESNQHLVTNLDGIDGGIKLWQQ